FLLGVIGNPGPGEATVDWLNENAPRGFPAGNTVTAAVVYLTLALVLTPLVPRRSIRVFLLSIAGLIVFLNGVSRLYLGLHFLSDIVAAWIGGLAWALACRGGAQTSLVEIHGARLKGTGSHTASGSS